MATIPAALVGKSIGFIGAGAMATAMMSGLLRNGVALEKLMTSDPFIGSRENIEKSLHVDTTDDNAKVVRHADVIVLAVKPHVIGPALHSIKNALDPNKHLIVSIAAGINIATIATNCQPGQRIIRTMPNTPCLVGQAAVGLAPGPFATEEDVLIAQALFSGLCVRVAEKDLDAVTALSGSGPAYVYIFIEALADAGVRAGLSRQVALQLAAQTVKGSAQMQISTQSHPAVLKDQVCSPGGTTIAAVEALEVNGFRAAVLSAVSAANQRAIEMGKAAALTEKEKEEVNKK
mmetsp:Transcript_13906/g.18559  ORF Transcript_13906/g.18559 Transcript_13906/m.18559 type:complete len:290 (+) Transcript_13906:50-919(+)